MFNSKYFLLILCQLFFNQTLGRYSFFERLCHVKKIMTAVFLLIEHTHTHTHTHAHTHTHTHHTPHTHTHPHTTHTHTI